MWEKAATYLQKAGEKSMEHAAYRQVVADLDRALVALRHLPGDRGTLERFVDVKLALRSVTTTLGEPDAGLAHANDALAASEQLQDDVRTALSCAAVVYQQNLMGRVAESLPLAQRGVTAAALTNDPRAALLVMTALGQTHLLLGNYREGRRCFESNLQKIREESVDLASLAVPLWASGPNSRSWLAFILADLGEFDEALRYTREAAALADARKLFYPLAMFVGQWTRVQRGDVTNAVPELERSLGVCRERNNIVLSVPFAAALGRAYTLTGRCEDAVITLNEAIALAEIHNRANRSIFFSFLSEAHLAAGQRDAAIRAAEVGLRGARDRQERAEEAWCLRALADALQIGERVHEDAAESTYRSAMALAAELGMRPVIAHCHAGLAKLFRTTKPVDADEHVRAATAMYREMGMTYWLEKLTSIIAERP